MSDPEHRTQSAPRKLQLPEAPASERGAVKAWSEPVEMLTYLPAAPDRNPLFLEKRVYQGSSGRVYPLPCIDRVAATPVPKQWNAIHIENEFVRVMILPEIGGRIHIGLDKRNGYDFFYRQNVIKPALVGLAGPWISGGVEFNWPQHHRPATFMPVATHVEREPSGAVTVWCSDHDPMQHMKGMHGIRLVPGRAAVELRVRLYNRTPRTQTFLWWANVGVHVHENYQSFFPPDVHFVADHAQRAVTSFPLSDRPYYGIDYTRRAAQGVPAEEAPPRFRPDGSYAANDLGWFANIPVPTSYMVTGSRLDFFGGYDHRAGAGFVHIANHHIAPGKKQWTWGNHEFGYAWDRSLTDNDGPYIELMAGVYTHNQPDFAFLAPGETKSFRQFWYPIADLGVPRAASEHAALHIEQEGGFIVLKLAVTHDIENATLTASANGAPLLLRRNLTLDPRRIFTETVTAPIAIAGLHVTLADDSGVLLCCEPSAANDEEPLAAEEPRLPQAMETVEELYLTGLHLEQYRHATRDPEDYWREALRRDPGDSRSLTAMGRRHLDRGELPAAEEHFRRAVARLTQRNPNPFDGEPFYSLGLTLRLLRQIEPAYDAFYKATWVATWRAPAYYALAEMDCAASRFARAHDHLRRALSAEAENNNAVSLLVTVLRRLGRAQEAEALLAGALGRDPLDAWFLYLSENRIPASGQECIDLALDLARAGLFGDAHHVLGSVPASANDGSHAPALYLLAWLHEQTGNAAAAHEAARDASQASPLYVFPSRVEEMLALEAACLRKPSDARPFFYLGNFLYDRRRHQEAIAAWSRAVELEPSNATAWRNLGLGSLNALHDSAAALDAYEKAFACDPTDARIFYERSQLWKRAGIAANTRLDELERHPALVELRDDLSLELATLLTAAGQPGRALGLLQARTFQPWEGGEGLVLGQYVAAHLALGRGDLRAGDAASALEHFGAALRPPANLGEAPHLLANRSQVYYWLGAALAALGRHEEAQAAYSHAARARGDFQQMSVQPVSEMTFWSALALRALGEEESATRLFQHILGYAEELEQLPATIDYFATSLPSMLLFEEEIGERRHARALLLTAQALFGLGRHAEATGVLHDLLTRDPDNADATVLLAELHAGPEPC